MTTRNFTSQVLLCIKPQGLFEGKKYYYCFADDGHVFWIHAPFLLEKIGVDQIKVSGELRENFVTEEEYNNQKRKLNTYKWTPKYLTG
tara:strand:- start:720 stop:983 length:264 start_codon:yes stop_codon:yes gene_type:complete